LPVILLQAIREKEAALETLVDRDRTIKKFRDLVQKLTDQSMELQNQLQVLSMKPLSALPEMADFKVSIFPVLEMSFICILIWCNFNLHFERLVDFSSLPT
jgi:hypothetical protein